MTIGKAVADCREVYSPPQPDAAGMDAFFRAGRRHRRGGTSVIHRTTQATHCGLPTLTASGCATATRTNAGLYGMARAGRGMKPILSSGWPTPCWTVWKKELFGLHDEDTVKAFKAHLRRSRSSRGKGGHAEGGAASGRHPRDAEHVRPPQGPFERGKRHGAAAHRRGAGAPPRGLPDAHCPGGIQRRDRLPDVGKSLSEKSPAATPSLHIICR